MSRCGAKASRKARRQRDLPEELPAVLYTEATRNAFLYPWLRPAAVLAARTFHRRLRFEHTGRVPPKGPVVIAANHPNMLVDVVLLAASTARTLHFLAKAPLFENRLLAPLLRAAGVLPVHRRREDPDKMEENLKTFEACHDLLARGGAIALFPEGVSHEREAVLPLKTGCARILLEAEAKHGFGLGASIVPVGIAFSRRELFRSDALVSFGEPIDPSPHFEACRAGNPGGAVRELTAELERALQRLAPHVPQEEDEELVAALRQFFSASSAPTSERLLTDRDLVEAIAYFREHRPEDYARLRRRLLRYRRVLELARIGHDDLDRTYRPGPVLRYLAPRIALGLLGLPLFLAGAIVHYLPYKIPGWLSRSLASERLEQGTIKLLSGLVVFPAFYLLVAVATGRPLLLVLLPFLGVFSLFYTEAISELLREVRIFLSMRRPDARKDRLRRFRLELIEELEELRRKYPPVESGKESHGMRT